MTKKKLVLSSLFVIFFIILFTIIWVYNAKMIDGPFTRLTIAKMGETTDVITDIAEINKIVHRINNSPRTLNPNNGFRYDYMSRGTLTFENDEEKVEVEFVLPKGNILTKYWEIETEFEFEK
ncbi:hypothetical protein V7654_06240 [Bacillus sp. JJ1609]|uniref:hypothetical protein n=1 Tax=Bacillus sp. JJ1609 TaxID=3122977 RepID=UPI002FFFD006